MNYDRSIVIDNIVKLMKDNHVSQSSLSDIINGHQSRVSECLNGKKDFTLPQIISISNYFNVSIDSLIGGQPKKTVEINSLSDICELLFILSENTDIHISNEYIDGYNLNKDELEYEATFNPELYDLISEDEINDLPTNGTFHVPARKGGLCISFFDNAICNFLSEWSGAISMQKLSNGKTLYNTWKEGVIQINKSKLKKYRYCDKTDCEDSL